MDLKKLPRILSDVTGHSLLSVTAPGGRDRESLRVQTTAGPMIVTQRKDAERGAREAHVVQHLAQAADLSPEFLGYAEGFLVQSDLGDTRLSETLQDIDPKQQKAGMRAAFQTLAAVQEVAQATGLTQSLPAVFGTAVAMRGLVQSVADMAARQGLVAVRMDADALIETLQVPAEVFVKWDARSGNAMCGPEGAVRWFDFEWAGRRSGLEDFVWMFGDEHWPPGPEATLEAVLDVCRDHPHLAAPLGRYGVVFMCTFAIILTARRVLHMMQALENGAFAHPQKARRMDLLSAHPDSLCRLCDRGVFLAGQDRHLLGFKAFFEDIRARAEAV